MILALCATACIGGELASSVWPPEDFDLVVDELRNDGAGAHVIRRLSVRADGVVIYGTSSAPLVDAETSASFPVFERLCIYRLEPASVRALARRLDRLGSGVESSGQPAGSEESAQVTVSWRAFERRRRLTSGGRLRGGMGDIVALVASYLPPGEAFGIRMTRPVVPVLRGVPEPAAGAQGALAALRAQLEDRPDDPGVLLDAFALACRVGERGAAEQLLQRWRAASTARAGTDGEGRQQAQAAAMRRMLPPTD